MYTLPANKGLDIIPETAFEKKVLEQFIDSKQLIMVEREGEDIRSLRLIFDKEEGTSGQGE